VGLLGSLVGAPCELWFFFFFFVHLGALCYTSGVIGLL
jgi:hypothetical protein